MKLLFDQNISHRLVIQIQDILPNSKQVRQLILENSSDKEIWEYAKVNGYTIVTFDGDFYDFSLVCGHPPKIIWLRTHIQTTKSIEKIIRKHLVNMKEFHNDLHLACLEIIDQEI